MSYDTGDQPQQKAAASEEGAVDPETEAVQSEPAPEPPDGETIPEPADTEPSAATGEPPPGPAAENADQEGDNQTSAAEGAVDADTAAPQEPAHSPDAVNPEEGPEDAPTGGEAAPSTSKSAEKAAQEAGDATAPATPLQPGSKPGSSRSSAGSVGRTSSAGSTAAVAKKSRSGGASPSASSGSVQKTSSGSVSKTDGHVSAGKPPSGANMSQKAGSAAGMKKTASSASADRGAGGSGAASPKRTSASQEEIAKSGSRASVKKTSSASREDVTKSGSTASVRKTASQDQVKKTSSGVSDKKPPSGTGSRASVKKVPSREEGDSPQKSASGGSKKRTASKAADADKTSQGGEPPKSASTEKTGSQVTVSGSRTSRRSRTSVRSQPPEEVWVPPQYVSEDFISRPELSASCQLSDDTLVFLHSFGYDCLKADNLCMLSPKTAMFISGNLIHFLDLETKGLTYMRSSTGGGIGHATVHPSYKYIAVAEKGDNPRIIIYRWPEKTVHRVLRGGTEREYTYVSFNASGDLLCSQGGDPDYMLTVWNWETESTLLRCKAFSQDVYKVSFSPFHPGQLTSAGLGHIKLWKMARTFTGLKLQGRLGRFGKTEISDINGFLQLPDGKVISGCEWGNILVWDNALIKVEITRRDGKPCHNGTIHKFYLEEGELISLGSDGWVRTWDFDTVDQAEAPEEMNGKYALDPMNELHFTLRSNLVSMWPHPDPEMESIWFMQDGSGGIWRADLSFSMTTKGPERLYECPAGPMRSLATCPTGTLMAVTGDDCHVTMYNYRTRDLLARNRFPSGGNTLIWLTQEVCGKTCLMLCGFADGCLRLLELHAGINKGTYGLNLVHVQKPHTAAITTMKQSPSGRMLVTASDDGSVWFFSLLIEEGQFTVAPLGFAQYGEPGETINCLEFVPGSEKKFLLFTGAGRVIEMRTPGVKDLTDHSTYGIRGVRGRSWQFKTVKSEILREEARVAREEEKEKQRTDLQADIDERIKLAIEVEETTEKAKLEKRLAEEDRNIPEIPLVVPDPPSPVLVGVPAADSSFTLLMDGWDAGWVHTASFREPHPAAVRVPGAEEAGISVRTFSPDGQYLVLGLTDGRIRIHALQDDPWYLNDYWHLSMHDNTYGRVTDVRFTYDQRNLVTSGADGNVFLFDFIPPEGLARPRSSKITLLGPPEERVDDIDDSQTYSLEQQRQRSAQDARLQLADQRKTAVKAELAELRREFKQWVILNQGLPTEVAVTHDELLLDQRIRAEQRRRAEENLHTALKEMEWEAAKYHLGRTKLYDKFKGIVEYERVAVRGFRNQREVSTLRVKKLSGSFLEARDRTSFTVSHLDVTTLSKIGSSAACSRSRLVLHSDTDANRFEQMSAAARRHTRKSVGIRAYRALLRLEKKRTKRRRRRTQWAKMMARRPDGTTDDPDDLAAIQAAVDSLGDFKLKTAADFKVVDSQQNTTHLKRHQLISVKEQIYKNKVAFNERVLAMRRRKTEVLREVCAALSRATELQKQLPLSLHVRLPDTPALAEDECPETLYQISATSLAEYRKVAETAAAIAHEDPAVVAAQAAAAAAAAAAETSTDGTAATTTPAGSLRRRSLLRARHQGPVDTAVHRAKPLVQRSDTDQALSRLAEIRTVFARDRELTKIYQLMEEFDQLVYDLWKDMVHIEYQLKNADLRLITRFRELMLVREFEKREAALNGVLQERMLEDAEGQLSLAEVTQRFEAHKREQEDLEQGLKDLAKEVTSNVPGDKYAKFLFRVYKKKIKRKSDAKKDDDDDSDSSSSMSDSDDEDDEDEDEDEDDAVPETWDLSACPPGCDPQLYDWVAQMRLKRGDLELELASKRLAFEVSKKEFEAAQKKARGATMALQASQDAIHAFQLQKLARLNELEVAVSLQLSQLQMLEDQRLPADISDSLVFWDAELERLAVRIDELYSETSEEKSKRRASYKEERRLKQDCRLMETYILKLQKQSVTEMKKKFGILVDLEELESLSVNETVEELRIRLEGEQRLVDSERAERKERMSHLRDELISIIRDNTDKVGVIQMLKDEKRHLDKGLNFVRKAGIAPHDKRLDDALEIENLMNTISLQKTQIMELKQEIWSLSLKSKPYRDPCRPRTAGPDQGASYDQLEMMESQCSEDFLIQMGLIPGPGGPAPAVPASRRGSGDSQGSPALPPVLSRSSTAAPSGGPLVLPPAPSDAEGTEGDGDDGLAPGAGTSDTAGGTGSDAAGVGSADSPTVGVGTETGQELTGGDKPPAGDAAATEETATQGTVPDGEATQTGEMSLDAGDTAEDVPPSSASGEKVVAEGVFEAPAGETLLSEGTVEAPTAEGMDVAPDSGGTEETPAPQVAPPDEEVPATDEIQAPEGAAAAEGPAAADEAPATEASPPGVPATEEAL